MLTGVAALLAACASGPPTERFYSHRPYHEVKDCVARELASAGPTAAVIEGSRRGYALADDVVLDAGITLTDDPPGTQIEYHFREGTPPNPKVDNAIANCT